MINKPVSFFLVRFVAVALIAILVTPATASVSFDLSVVSNGATPSGSAPWLTAVFTTSGANTVELKLIANLQDSDEFFDNFGFNSTIAITSITQTSVGNPVGTPSFGSNNQSVIGSFSGFDALIDFPQPNADRFRLNQMATFSITGTGLTENSFNTTNADGWFVASHVQGLTIGGPSGVITGVPEPSSLGFAIGLTAIGMFVRRRRAVALSAKN